ncbi:MAG: hypothetical protein KGJ05_00325, partial [Alphaproteobacteria bacterium]|nr:hypothetical protein [Alphaproteobacteria bacterium]
MKLSARSLGKYGVCALAGTGVAWLAGSNAVGNINLWSNPEHAMGRIGLGSFPGARTADLHLALDKTPRPPGAFADMARASLQVEALNAPALRILGLAAAAGGDQAKATQLMGLAQAVTRRDGATQLWFINQAAQQGDIKAALAHYDKALRVNAAIQPQLFPTLGQALANPAVRTAMVPYIKSPPNWMAAFVTSTLAQPQSVANIAETLNTAG